MKACKYFFMLLMITFGMSVQCLASPQKFDTAQISENYYIQPGGVYVAPNGIFVLYDDNLVQINVLCSDEKGVYVPGFEMSRRFVWCPFCEHWYDPDRPHKCK